MKKWNKIICSFLLITVSYFIASRFLTGNAFYIFDFIWRIAIILGVLLTTRAELDFSGKQWLTLLFFWGLEILFYSKISPETSWIRILIAIVGAPLAEELFFRGWLIDRISGSNKKKIIISSILFALYHLKNISLLTTPALFTQVAYAGLIVGPAFAWIRLKYDSLFLVLLLHSGNNAFADTLTPKIIPTITQRKSDFV